MPRIPQHHAMPPDTLPEDEAAKIIRVPRRTLRAWRGAGVIRRLPFRETAGSVRYRVEDVHRLRDQVAANAGRGKAALTAAERIAGIKT